MAREEVGMRTDAIGGARGRGEPCEVPPKSEEALPQADKSMPVIGAGPIYRLLMVSLSPSVFSFHF